MPRPGFLEVWGLALGFWGYKDYLDPPRRATFQFFSKKTIFHVRELEFLFANVFQKFCRIATNSCLVTALFADRNALCPGPMRFLPTAAFPRHGGNTFSLKKRFFGAATEIHAFPNNN